MYIALYRKWRPKRFEDICGQEHITRILKNQIKTERISHAYLFCGTRGTGKTSTAKILAKAVNCTDLQDNNPCEVCDSCKAINEGKSIDVFEIDAASNRGIDNIRDLREAVRFTPIGKYKLYIIDEVHMLTNEAFNALLKTLEEPPSNVIFILATTEPHKLPPTVLSRCQRFDFKRISQESVVKRLEYICKEEDIKVTEEALHIIARNTDGAMRDAISIVDQCSIYSNKDIKAEDVTAVLGIVSDSYLFEIANSILEEDVTRTINILKEVSQEGKDIYQFAKDLQIHYRNLLMAKLMSNAEEVIDQSKEKVAALKEQSNKYGRENIIRCINILSDVSTEIKWNPLPKLSLEIALVKMCKLSKDKSSEGMLARLAKLEKLIAEGEISIAVTHPVENIKKEDKKDENSQADADRTEDTAIDEFASAEEITLGGPVPVEEIYNEDSIKEPELKDEIEEEEIKTKVIESWDSFLRELGKRKKVKLRTYLASCKPMMVCGSQVMLCFGSQDNFSKEAVENIKTKKEIEDIAEEYFGTPIIIKAVFEEEVADADEVVITEDVDIPDYVGEANNENTDGRYVVDKAIELFGADYVEVVED